MSKREADEYITKEAGSTPNRVEEKVKMATAAQMAKRKVAAPRSRLNRATPTLGTASPSSTGSNPFAAGFGASQPQQPSFSNPGGIVFGESKSFPAGASASGGGFNFSAPPPSSSFTFGETSSNNPFANLNGNTSAPANDSSEDAMMESPQKKPAFGSSMFGAGNQDTNNSGGFNGFGQSVQQQPTQPQNLFGGFGQNQTNGFGSSLSTPLFGQPQSKPESQGGQTASLFGQTLSAQNAATDGQQSNGIFGSSTASKNPFSFGQTSSSETTTQPPAFGSNQPQPRQSLSSSTAPTFQFGKVSSSAESQVDKPSVQFGQTPEPQRPLFGAVASTSSASNANSSFGSSQFNAPTQDAQGAQKANLFGGIGNAKANAATSPAGSASEQASSHPSSSSNPGNSNSTLSSTSHALDSSVNTKSNPFGSLFGFGGASDAPSSSNGPTSSSEAPMSGFSFNAPSPVAETPVTSQQIDKAPPKSLFGFSSSQSSTSPSMFAPPQTTADTTSHGSSFAGQFAMENGLSKETSKNKVEPSAAIAGQGSSGFDFGKASQMKASSSAQEAGSESAKPATQQSTGSIFPTSSQQTFNGSRETNDATPAMTPAPSIFGNSNTAKHDTGLKTATTTAAPSAKLTALKAASTPDHGISQNSITRNVYSNPPARIPAHLSAENYKSYDSNYRLHSLNREFQKRIASLDPSKDDFENIMRSYVAARESIGESIGLYTRNVAGMKRKTETFDDHSEEPPTAKRSRQVEAQPAQSTPTNNQSSNSIFKPVTSASQPAKNNPFATLSSGTSAPSSKGATASNNSQTSSLFKSMIPDTNKAALPADKPAVNPFASLFDANKDAPPTAPATLFASPAKIVNDGQAKGSTTPPTSPPKKAQALPTGFQVPKFGAPSSGDFFGTFAKQSEASRARFEKEAMEKRKAEDFDSDEDDLEEWTKKDEEAQRAKQSKIGEVTSKGFVPNFGSMAKSSATTAPVFSFGAKAADPPASNDQSDASHSEASDDDENADGDDVEEVDAGDQTESEQEDDLPEDEADNDADQSDNGDMQRGLDRARAKQPVGKSLFERITRDSTPQQESSLTPNSSAALEPSKQSSLFASPYIKSTPEAPSFSPITPSTNQAFVPSKTFSFTPTPKNNPSPTPGASVFDGGITKNGPIPGEGLFGSRSSTPVNGDRQEHNVFGNSVFGGFGTSQSTPATDHTWKKGSGIKFGTSDTDAPSVSITEASPQAKDTPRPFATLFGAGSGTANGASSGSLGFSFAGSNQPTAPGYLGAASHLLPASATSSAMSSRATSPGLTDNESVATDSEDAQNDPQTSLMTSRPGEEDEDVLFEARTRALRNYNEDEIKGTKKTKGWNVEGLGAMRILKNRSNNKTRIVLRADPGANIILNTMLLPDLKYVSSGTEKAGTVSFPVFENGKPRSWMLKVKTAAIAKEMAEIMEKNKGQKSA